jgi:hypothetical protein
VRKLYRKRILEFKVFRADTSTLVVLNVAGRRGIIVNITSILKAKEVSQACWCISVIPTLGKLGQEEREFGASLDYIVNSG